MLLFGSDRRAFASSHHDRARQCLDDLDVVFALKGRLVPRPLDNTSEALHVADGCSASHDNALAHRLDFSSRQLLDKAAIAVTIIGL